MRKEFRFEQNHDYWNKRWSKDGADAETFSDVSIYPVKYSDMVVKKGDERIAELGCGLGRLVSHYHSHGFNIVGIERSIIAVEKIKMNFNVLKVFPADVMALPFVNESFDVILAFGLYHNMENGMEKAIEESFRCLRTGGSFCISMRPDNFEMWLNEWYWKFKNRKNRQKKYFHKCLVREEEFTSILRDLGGEVQQIKKARNMSILWRLPFLRNKKPGGRSSEAEFRSSGYSLNRYGKWLDALLVGLFPGSFCNVIVFIGKKKMREYVW